MHELQKYYIGCFKLTLHPGTFLVEVRFQNHDQNYEHNLLDLPDWIFESRLAIWLMAEGDSIHQRALDGEAVRQKLRACKLQQSMSGAQTV